MRVDKTVELCCRFEGFRSAPYLDPVGIPTIGYGTTHYPDGRAVSLDDPPIDELTARAYMMTQLIHDYAPSVQRLCPGLVPLAILNNDWDTFCAILDFTYNLGAGNLQISTLRRKINECDWAGARIEIMRWVNAGGKVLRGLVLRRAAEADLLPQ